MGDLLDDYPVGAAWDEMFESPGTPRPPYEVLHQALQALSGEEFAGRCVARDHAFRNQGITFSHQGEERPFPLDLVPRVLSAAEWGVIEAGVAQRVRALEAFLTDVYGVGEILRAGVVPRRVVTRATGFQRPAVGVDPANGVRIHVAGIDLVRCDGEFRVLEDNVRTPSGISYVIENRRTMARVMPELFDGHRVRPVDSYPARLLEALRAATPTGTGEPRVVVLTAGVFNAAYFEHAFLARQMGVELVEGRDLICRGNVVYMRSTEGEQRVDVVYRRVDDDFLDALHFRTDSVVGCPGILNAARAGNVTIANAVGNGVADDKLIYSYVPDMIDYYLGERPLLANVDTYRLEDPDQMAYVIGHLDQLVLKPVDGSGGYGLVMGPAADAEELERMPGILRENPRGWIAQEVMTLSTSPTQVGQQLKPRHVDLRPFAVNDGERVWVVPGALTRVALPEGSLIVNSSQGGGSKDTWVLADGPNRPAAKAAPTPPVVPAHRPGARPPDPGPAATQANQQQQLTVAGSGRRC